MNNSASMIAFEDDEETSSSLINNKKSLKLRTRIDENTMINNQEVKRTSLFLDNLNAHITNQLFSYGK